MTKFLGACLCILAWSIQVLFFMQPLLVSRINPDVGVCEHIVEQHNNFHIKNLSTHSNTPKTVKKYVGQHCLFCTFYHALLSLGQLPKLWKVSWTSYFISLFVIACLGIFKYFKRYRNPPSQAPPIWA